MTMLLYTTISFPVVPSKKGEGWFEISGRPVRADYSGANEYYGDFPEAAVPGAKIVGLHDVYEDLEEDPRFEDPDSEDPAFVIFKWEDGSYEAAVDVNAPEALLFNYIIDGDDPANAEAEPSYRYKE